MLSFLFASLLFRPAPGQSPAPLIQLTDSAGVERGYGSFEKQGNIVVAYYSQVPDDGSSPYKIWSASYDLATGKASAPFAVAPDVGYHQWGASTTTLGNASFLAFYHSAKNTITGSRDVVLFRYDGFFHRSVVQRTLTQQEPLASKVATNHSSPSIAPGLSPGTLAEVNYAGQYFDSALTDGPGSGHFSALAHERHYMGIRLQFRRLDLDGRVQIETDISPGGRVFEENPAVAADPARRSYLVAFYTPDGSSTTDKGEVLPRIGLRRIDANGKVIQTVFPDMSKAGSLRSGAITPKLIRIDGAMYLGFIDVATNDIVVARLDDALELASIQRLRNLLTGTKLAHRPLFSPSLFRWSEGKMGIGFVATDSAVKEGGKTHLTENLYAIPADLGLWR